jgi:DNA replicative helicase MCM subunit Mcm2 (Cdc46/Mcm family)
MTSKAKNEKDTADQITRRLDALIRLLIETAKPRSKDSFSEAQAARVLKSAGLTPTEIARILGKKSATDVAPYLYPKKKS